jgi:hypothetical protein
MTIDSRESTGSTSSLLDDLRSLESKLPDGVRAIDKARTHARLELANDTDVILPTVTAWDTNFAVLKVTPGGDLSLVTVLEYDDVEPWYVEQNENVFRHKQYRLNEYNGRWFQFTEQCADLTHPKTGAPVPCHVCTLFPTWSDGIVGEIALGQPEWGERALDEQGWRRLSCLLDSYDEAWLAGDVSARLATIEDDTCSVIRIVEVDGDRRHRAIARTRDELREAWLAPAEGRLLEVERVHQFMTSWYVFAAYVARVELADRIVVRETGRLLPVGPNLKFVGELTYSMETDSPRPS